VCVRVLHMSIYVHVLVLVFHACTSKLNAPEKVVVHIQVPAYS